MGLTVYLTDKNPQWLVSKSATRGPHVRDRETGQVREMTVLEWNRLHPSLELVDVDPGQPLFNQVFAEGINHNVGCIARHIGVHRCLWRAPEKGFRKASQLTQPLRDALDMIRAHRESLRMIEAPNGFGTVEQLEDFLLRLHQACVKHPEAELEVWR